MKNFEKNEKMKKKVFQKFLHKKKRHFYPEPTDTFSDLVGKTRTL